MNLTLNKFICFLCIYFVELDTKCIKWWLLTNKLPYTTIAEFANTVDPDERAHEPSHLDLQCLPSSL